MSLFPYFAADKKNHDGRFLNIIQRPQVADPQFILGEWIGAQAFDGVSGRRRALYELRLNYGLHDPLFAYREPAKLTLRIFGN